MQTIFRKFATKMSDLAGSPWAFILAVGIIVVWAMSGPLFHFGEIWQLVINTGTTIVTFLLLFLVQNTQNRDSQAIHLKLDELIRALAGARNSFVDLEDLSDEELHKLHQEFQRLRQQAGGIMLVDDVQAVRHELSSRNQLTPPADPSSPNRA